MAQFDVFENPNEETNQAIPYLLDVQADLLDGLSTRVVVPLIASSAMGKPIKHLNPQFTIRDTPVFMSTAELAGIHIRFMGEKVSSLKDQRHDIIAALDFLFTGF
ncbi:CcdB family protein [Desulforhabdus amnigena]|uniref:Toxin CcdB n=1 Tax=Desulforhabdus amnigena TaxID=40218 RepID=A0A9W6CZX1_9BACT|nr:CcdB family protein [Desulforhabdus amnigena]NLJ27770.1 plasmid maintenance protein CcdB [Deltaproteobacteria bacterium]GLI33270.1 plasmid maintenance protein CcdB [Desulforhabdus amnigena]